MGEDVTYRFDKGISIPDWVRLYKVSDYHRWWTERHAQTALDYAYLVATAWDEGAIVGTLTVWSDGMNFAWLDDLVVHPDYRRRGIGTSLVRETLARLKPLGLHNIQLFPIPGRESFFTRLGFEVQRDARVMDYAGREQGA